MDYIKPNEVVKLMIETGDTKAGLSIKDLLLRGLLSGALLGFATSLAITAAAQTGIPLVGALIFPIGFVIIVLLGLELVTGSFAVVMLAGTDGRRSWRQVFSNLFWVFTGNLIGSLLYGVLLYCVLTTAGSEAPAGIAAKIVAIAEAKTTAYAAHGTSGMITVFVKAILCNWMVTLGLVMALASRSTLGKIVGAWLPIVVFFAQGFEHSVVNMFVIPTGIMLGAKVSVTDWWLWNQLPVTIGNLLGGFLFTGLFLYWTYPPVQKASVPLVLGTDAAPDESGEELAQA
ncbi:MAG TPA: formate/nitrite transporter family protein [Verrucomicrobiae bacterium]|jgi:formate/nitrite transporter